MINTIESPFRIDADDAKALGKIVRQMRDALNQRYETTRDALTNGDAAWTPIWVSVILPGNSVLSVTAHIVAVADVSAAVFQVGACEKWATFKRELGSDTAMVGSEFTLYSQFENPLCDVRLTAFGTAIQCEVKDDGVSKFRWRGRFLLDWTVL